MKRATDTFFDMLMRFLADIVLPEGKILPSSLYMVERVMQSRLPDSCSYHACPHDHFVWPHLPRSDWSAHRDDLCPTCASSSIETRRFVVKTAAGSPASSLQR